MQSRIQPTLSRMARNATQSAHPELWRGLVGAWVPALGIGPGGNRLLDVSGNGNHGTLTNMDPQTDWVAGPQGRALDFDGVNDIVAATRIDFSGENFSIFMSLTPTVDYAAGGQVFDRIVSSRFATAEGGFTVTISDAGQGTRCFGFSYGTTAPQSILSQNNAYQTGKPNTLCGVRLGSTPNIYVNGTLSNRTATINGIGQAGSGALIFGGREDLNADTQYSGTIHAILIYARALSSSEIMLLHADPLAPFRLRERRRGFVSLAGFKHYYIPRPRRIGLS